MNTQQKPVLLHLENVGGDEDRNERRWDPAACNGKGAWIVSGYVLGCLKMYFPNIDAWIAKSTASNTPTVKKPLDIDEVPF